MAKKSMLQNVKDVCRTVAKATGYVAGTALIAWPAVDFVDKVVNGTDVKVAADQAIFNGFGVSVGGGALDKGKLVGGATRTITGAAMIYFAKKL